MAGITVLLLLSGCMDTATRLWNGGPYMSQKESEAYDQCFDEVSAQDPEMAKPDLTQAELLEFGYRVRPCMERKGYYKKPCEMRPVTSGRIVFTHCGCVSSCV